MSQLPENAVYTVTEAVNRLKSCLEQSFPFLWVKGEVTDFSQSASGHFYFALKDQFAKIKCVWFAAAIKRASQKFDPLTGEVFEKPKPPPSVFLQNGADVLCAGRITFYPQGGICQLAVDFAEPAGYGAAALAFADLKKRLAAAGYFDREHKREIPVNPKRIALLTSLHGAAMHDFLEIGSKRGLPSHIRLYSVPVQGENAAEKIAETIRLANSQAWADVIVLIRGGGSLEDLWQFNEEVLAAAIYNSSIPVLTGIGHETDLSLADMTADAYGVTPSHAAQILWHSRTEIWQNLDTLCSKLDYSIKSAMQMHKTRLGQLQKTLCLLSPLARLNQQKIKVENIKLQLEKNFATILSAREKSFLSLFAKFQMLAALETRLQYNKERLERLSKYLDIAVQKMLAQKCERHKASSERLEPAIAKNINNKLSKLKDLGILLKSLDPYMPLKRGYALIYNKRNMLLSAQDCAKGQEITAILSDGRLKAIIREVEINQQNIMQDI